MCQQSALSSSQQFFCLSEGTDEPHVKQHLESCYDLYAMIFKSWNQSCLLTYGRPENGDVKLPFCFREMKALDPRGCL